VFSRVLILLIFTLSVFSFAKEDKPFEMSGCARVYDRAGTPIWLHKELQGKADHKCALHLKYAHATTDAFVTKQTFKTEKVEDNVEVFHRNCGHQQFVCSPSK
jgi:hypothetical protein